MTGETMMQQAQLPQEQQQQQQQLQQKQLTELEQPEQLPQETQQTQQTQQQQQQQQPGEEIGDHVDQQQQQQPDNQSSDQDMAEQESNDQEDMVQAESDDQEDMDQETQAHVQQQRQRELGKLHAIDAKVRQVHERLTSRLPRQRAHLAAKVCGAVWAVRASRRHDTSSNRTDNNTTSLAKKLRLELGAFDYQVREQGELLTRHLCDLDDVLSFGDAAIKDARKALVVFIQSEALPLADALREQSAKLRAFGERLISTLPVESSEADVQAEAQATRSDSSAKMPSPSSTASDAVDSDVDVDMHPLFGTDDESADEVDNDDGDDVSDEGEGEDEDMSEADDDKDEDEEEGEDEDRRQQEEEEEDDDESIEERAPVSAPTATSPGVDTRSLPVWKPYYQIHKRRDALYLVANLRDVDPQNVRVQWLERAGGSGVLHISGVKLPTQRDVMVSRFSGVPTFGRFEIAERVPANAVDMSRASQTLREDGTLEVRMPYVSVASSSSSSSSGYNYPRRYSVAGYPYSSDSNSYPSDYYRHQQQIHHPLHPLQQYYQQQQGYPHSAFRRRVSPWFDAPRCAVW